ncbi:MAG: alpha/beta fold hydrolase [Pseudomonadota bacterium]
MPEDFGIPHAGRELAGRLFRPEQTPLAGVVIAHGLYSSMISQKLNRLALSLAQTGHLALMFDASGCGASPGDIRRTTLTSRRDQFLAAAQALARVVPGLPLAYMGSSLGGTAALLAARQRPPLCLACWSTPVDLTALMLRLAAQPQPPDLPEMVDDIPRHDLPAALATCSRLLVVHGQEDEVVPVEQGRLAHHLAGQPKELLVLPGADHRLSGQADQEQATARTLAWLARFAG